MTVRDPPHSDTVRANVVRLVVSALLAVAIFWFLATRVDVASAWAGIRDMSWLELATVAAVTGWNLLTYWALWVAATPGLKWSQAAVLAQAGTALTNTVPGGSALGVRLAYGMLDSWGFSRQRSSQVVLVTGASNVAVKLGLPVVALTLVALQGDAGGRRVAEGALALVLLTAAAVVGILFLRSEPAARSLGDAARRVGTGLRRLVRRPQAPDWGQSTVDFRRQVGDMLQRRWVSIVVAAVVSHLSLYAVLLVALRHAGVPDAAVGWAEVLFVFACMRLLTIVRVTPGAAGVAEALLIGGLTAAGGAAATVTAAVLVFRALTWLLPVPLGALAFLGWRLGRSGRPGGTRPDPVPATPAA